MTAWLPCVGELFYAQCTRTLLIRSGDGNTVTLTKQRDASFSGDILRVVGSDEQAVVADIVYGFVKKRYVLLRADYVFKPVGPAVVEALGLAP